MTGDESSVESGAVDVLRYETDEGPVYRATPAGEGEAVVAAHEREVRERRTGRLLATGTVVAAIVLTGVVMESVVATVAGLLFVAVVHVSKDDDHDESVPELVERNQFRRDAERAYDLEDG
ncbi:hypothetical protein I7X12_09645 [Halosimplex litoreum]|uniref:Uncharacterized protein n=1 Tax=Halosimplex litoreum TaxID=1198301 RepID=A0A7U3WB45_9EURY|nr:hypothetical protein [Halosimplex litoreum]QPV64840.1 hypothetical protein I7X12_09645 [Halosimplex litoreum]